MLWTPTVLNRLTLLHKHSLCEYSAPKYNIVQQRPLLIHLAAMTVVGLVDLHEYTYSSIIH